MPVLSREIGPASSDSVTAIVPLNSPLARKLKGYQPNSKLLEMYGLNNTEEPIAITSSGSENILIGRGYFSFSG